LQFSAIPRILPTGRLSTTHEPTEEEWRTLARQALKEQDPEKLLDLIQQVIEKYDEAKLRLRRIA
jgi:hypothetical protein